MMSSDETNCGTDDRTSSSSSSSTLTRRQTSCCPPRRVDSALSLPPQAVTQPTTTTTTPNHHQLTAKTIPDDAATNPTTKTSTEEVADEASTTLAAPPSSTPASPGSYNGRGPQVRGATNGCALPQEAERSRGVPSGPRTNPSTTRMATQNTVRSLPLANVARLQRERERLASLSQRLVKGKPVKRKLWEVDHVQTALELEEELARVTEEDQRRFHQRWEVLPPEYSPEAPSYYFSQVLGPAAGREADTSTTSSVPLPPTPPPGDIRRTHAEAKRRRTDSAETSAWPKPLQVFSTLAQVVPAEPSLAQPKTTTTSTTEVALNGSTTSHNSGATASGKSCGVDVANVYTTASDNSCSVSSSSNSTTTVTDNSCSVTSSNNSTTITSDNSCSVTSSSSNATMTSNNSCSETLNNSQATTPNNSQATTPNNSCSETNNASSTTTPNNNNSCSETKNSDSTTTPNNNTTTPPEGRRSPEIDTTTSPRTSYSSEVSPKDLLNISGSSKSSSGVSSADSTPSEVATPSRETTTPTQERFTPRRSIRQRSIRSRRPSEATGNQRRYLRM